MITLVFLRISSFIFSSRMIPAMLTIQYSSVKGIPLARVIALEYYITYTRKQVQNQEPVNIQVPELNRLYYTNTYS
jgi:hypothetical protein